MFYGNRSKVAESLEGLRLDTCAYLSPSFCDCKYGYTSDRNKKVDAYKAGKPFYPNHGEHTCCPELRCAIAVLNKLTDEEYERVLARKVAADDLIAT